MANAPNTVNNAPPMLRSVDVLSKDALGKPSLSLSGAWKLWLSWLYTFVTAMVNYANVNPQVVLTGFSLTIGNTQTVLTLNPAGTLATGTVTMPAAPFDGMPVEINSTHTVTGFTLSANAGQTIKNAPTTLTAGSGVMYFYNAASSTWFRRV